MIRSPLTGSPDVTLVRTIQTVHLIQDWKSTFGIDITAEFRGHESIFVYQCNQTGLVFFRPAAVTGSSWLYRQLEGAFAYYSPIRWEHSMALRDVRGIGTLLEIGCGSGSFIKKAIELGIDARGLELNYDAAAKARSEGLVVESADLDQAFQGQEGVFDCVCCFQVLEHVPEPGQFLRSCLRLVKPGGMFIASVPNEEGFLKYYYEILDLPPHHMSQWTRATFQALQEYYDIHLAKCACEPLAANHVKVYVNTYANRFRARSWLINAALGQGTIGRLESLLQLGFRRLLRGHALYTKFVKTVPRGSGKSFSSRARKTQQSR